MSSLHIAVLPGDGIGVEVVGEALAVLRHLAKIGNTLSLDFDGIPRDSGRHSTASEERARFARAATQATGRWTLTNVP